MKKLIFITLFTIILAGCSQDLTYDTSDIKNNSQTCIENLQKDQYIQACLDLKTESKLYIEDILENDSRLDYDLYNDIINNLTLITDVSNDEAIVKEVNNLIIDLETILQPSLEDQNFKSYKDIEDDSNFKITADSFINKTSLKYQDTAKVRLDYNSDDYLYKTIFTDDNGLRITYFFNQDQDIDQIIIENNTAIPNLYYNFAKVYTRHILIDQLKLNENAANHDAILVEKQLQFENEDQYRSKDVSIVVENQVVTIKPES